MNTQKREDLTGWRSFKLVGIMELPEKAGRRTLWLCKCDCGNECKVSSGNLKSRLTKSCGCLRPITHYSYQPYYNTWIGIIGRCYKPKHREYKDYGGRGITMCDEWRYSYPTFHKWMVDNGARKGLTVDRYPDNDGNYCPENCRLATPKQQNRNTRSNRKITIDGVTKIFIEWCEFYSISKLTVFNRFRLNWDMKKAFTHPVTKYKKRRNGTKRIPTQA